MPLLQGTERFRAAAASDRAVSCRCRGPSDFLFACPKRKSPKRNDTPRRRLPGVLPGKSVSRGRAFRSDSCPVEKASPSVGSPAARPPRPRLTAAEGPRKSGRASCAPEARAQARAKPHEPAAPSPAGRAKPKRAPHQLPLPQAPLGGEGRGEGEALAVALAVASARWERAALPGAPMARRAGGGKSDRMARTDAGQFFAGTGVPSKNPGTRPRTRKAGCLEGAPSGCPFSLVPFSLGTQRESSSGAGRRSKPLCSLR